jgi:hypothetical protein
MQRRIYRRVLPWAVALLCILGAQCMMTTGWCSDTGGWFTGDDTAAATSADGTPVAQAATLPGDELGNTFEGFGAANWAMGRYADFKFAIAFIPRASKRLSSMTICWKTARGYGGGTYGVWSFELQRNNTRGHLPSGTVLARLDGKTNPPEGYYKLDFPGVDLQAGEIYHLVMYNTDPRPMENWSSPNTIMSFPDRPWRGEGALSFDGRGWRDWGAKDNRCAPYRGSRAAYLLEYADGTKEGMPYYFAYEHRIHGGTWQGEQFTWTQDDVQVRQFGFSVFSNGVPKSELRFVLEEANGGKVLASDIVAKPDGMTELPQWQRVTLDDPVTLKKGVSYRLYLKAPDCSVEHGYATYVVYATQAVPGWGEQTWGGISGCAVTYEGAWKRTPVPADLTFSMIAE